MALCGALTALAACDPSTPYSGAVTADQEVVVGINGLRSNAGRPDLSLDAGLDTAAQSWANELAHSGVLRHSGTVGASRAYTVAGENVGTGSSIDAVADAFAHSPAHMANMLDKRFTLIGIGVAVDGGGQVWVVEQFLRPA